MRVRIPQALINTVIPLLGEGLIRSLYGSLRVETLGQEHLASFWNRGERTIIACWHDQLLLTVCGYSGPGARMLISASKDGDMLARTFARFGQQAVRGSSSRGGKAALKAMIELSRSEFDLAITPDGPKGPRHQVKDGVLQLARVSKRPIIPMSFACARGHRFASWDRFLCPYPFSRAVFSFGAPLFYDPKEELSDFRERVRLALNENTSSAAKRLNDYGLSAV